MRDAAAWSSSSQATTTGSAPPGGDDLLGDLGEPSRVSALDRYAHPLPGEGEGGTPPDAAACAGDEGGLAGEFEIHMGSSYLAWYDVVSICIL